MRENILLFFTVLSFASSSLASWYALRSWQFTSKMLRQLLRKLDDKKDVTSEEDLNARLEQLQRMKFSPMRARIEK